MRVPLTVLPIVLTITLTALFGMALGGAFGYGAATLAPGIFSHPLITKDVEPQHVAMVVGGAYGVLCGGALGGFAVAMQAVAMWLEKPRRSGPNDFR